MAANVRRIVFIAQLMPPLAVLWLNKVKSSANAPTTDEQPFFDDKALTLVATGLDRSLTRGLRGAGILIGNT